MSKFKYKLVEQDEPQGGGEESGLKGIKVEQELTLTTMNDLTSEKVLAILKDPKYLKGVENVYVDKSEELLNLEKQVFGDNPTNPKKDPVNKEIYVKNGVELYKKIEAATNKKFERGIGKFITNVRKKGDKELFTFPIKSSSNLDLVKTYLGEKSKTQIKPKVVDANTLKFPLSDKSDLEKILKNAEDAKVISSKDYTLEKTDKLDENTIRQAIKEQFSKIFNK
jgi:Na+-transporting NADH:ubiquinone oxidoreductase subunit NqrC